MPERSEPHVPSDHEAHGAAQGLARDNRYHNVGSEKVLASSLMRGDVEAVDGCGVIVWPSMSRL